jgi:hypothetical protein
MMKREKRLCRVARSHPLSDLQAIDDDLLRNEVHEDQRSLIRRMHKVHRMKSFVRFMICVMVALSLNGFPVERELHAQSAGNPFAAPYANLDPQLIRTNLLHNRSPWYYNSFLFDTINFQIVQNPDWIPSPYKYDDGIIEMSTHTFMHLYQEMLYSCIHDSVILNPEEYKAGWDQSLAGYRMPISLMALSFNHIPYKAFGEGKIWYDTLTGTYGPFPDTLWLPDTLVTPDTVIINDSLPYITFANPDSLLALAFERQMLYGAMVYDDILYSEDTQLSVTFGVPQSLFISNMDSLPYVEIDFGDGLGYRPVPWDTPMLVNYHLQKDPQVQRITILIKLPFLNFDMVLQQYLIAVADYIKPDTVVFTDDLPLFDCQPLEGSTAAPGKISILFADTLQQKLIKPVLFVEGFESALVPYGDITFMHIMNGLMPELGYPEVAELPLLFDSLIKLGYDLVYLDFENSRDSLERNMLTVVKVIQFLNQELALNGSFEKLVVTGASMGGLLTRYALRQMELDRCCHNTRLWISFDAPHRGAHIPMSVQYLLEYAADESQSWKGLSFPLTWVNSMKDLNITLKNPDAEQKHELVLNSPAARAMLIQHIDQDATDHHQSFYAMMDSIGYPDYCRKIALINGSENGVRHQLDDTSGLLLSTGVTRPVNRKWEVFTFGFNLVTPKHYSAELYKNFTVGYSKCLSEEKSVMFERNDWSEAINQLNKIMWCLGVHTGINCAIGITAAILGPTNPVAITYCEAAMFVNKTIGNFRMADLHKPLPKEVIVSTPAMQHLTTAPGGLSDALKKLADALEGMVTAHSNTFSFIPSVSALDVKNMQWDADLKNLYLFDQEITPLDAYWAPRRVDQNVEMYNMAHVTIDSLNRIWLLEHLTFDCNLWASNARYFRVLDNGFNYGRQGSVSSIIALNQPFERVLYSMDIVQGGTLYVNRQADIGFSGSYQLPKPMGSFRLVVNGDPCDPAIVRVMSGGALVLGDLLNYNTAEMVFSPGTTLELFPGSRLDLYDHSRLLIADGARLVIHPGATIVLHHPEAVLEIRGRLELADDAVLSADGPGYLLFNAPMTAGSEHLFFGVGKDAAIKLEGAGKGHRKMMVASDTWLPYALPLEVTDAALVLAEGVSLHTPGPLSLENVWVRAHDTTTFYGAVMTFGQVNIRLKNTTFSHGSTGFKANLSIGGNPLQLEGCEFRNNITGLHSIDEKVRMKDCLFRNNHQNGWLADNKSGFSVVDQSTFRGQGLAGIRFAGQLSSGLLLREVEMTENFNGVQIFDGTLRASCSRFTQNLYAGIMAEKNSRVLLGGESKNQLTGNFIGLALNQALELDLYNGHLKFSGNSYYIIGEMLPNLYFDLNTHILKSFDLSGNHMPFSPAGLPVHIYIEHPVHLSLLPFSIQMQTMVPETWTHCNNNLPWLNEHLVAPVLAITGASVISGGQFHNYMFSDALYQAAMLVSCDEYQGNDTLAIAALSDLLQHLPLLLNDEERGGVDYALHLMTLALGNAIDKRLIDPNRGVDGAPADAFVEMIAQRVQEQLNDVDGQNLFAEEMEARYALMKAQMYRVAEHYDYALQILEVQPLFSGTALATDAAYWKCVCTAERLMLIDSLDRTAFHNRMDSCSFIMYTARMRPFMPVFGSVTFENTRGMTTLVERVYPNPADRRIVVDLSRKVQRLEAELTDPSGRRVYHHTEEWCGSSVAITLPQLPPGVYILKINAMDTVSHHKVMIRQY